MWGGKPAALAGEGPKVGGKAPPFTALAGDLSTFSSASLAGKVAVILSMPSLDTGTCAAHARRFEREAASLGDKVQVLAVSMDLPFAQKRFCTVEGIANVHTLSDHRDASFGSAFGLLIPALRLLARSVTVVDAAGVVRYHQLVHETGTEPDYDAALAAVEQLV
jgi:thioredoxin-dependent peroxiredoxin